MIMGIAQATKNELFQDIERLSNPYLQELKNFVRYLRFKQTGKGTVYRKRRALPPENDPILQLIGFVDAAPFSDNIDELLYGKA